jgi:energy-coupling factor transporter ATP-binding protein EcfA2
MAYIGKTIELIGDSGSGKTTQFGELAKFVWKSRRKKSKLNTCDRGGYDSISPLVRLGIVQVNELQQTDDPWLWINSAISGDKDPEIGLECFDSGTSMGDILLTACSQADFQIGQQRTQKFTVSRGEGKATQQLTVSINNEAHYGVVQGFMLDAIRKSTWLINQGRDVLWTFALLRGESQDRTPILGPKLCGKALTPFLPKEFRYTFRLDVEPIEGQAPEHVLYTTVQPELAGMGHSFGNIRCPLGVKPPDAVVRPASLITAFEQMEAAHREADEMLAQELGL